MTLQELLLSYRIEHTESGHRHSRPGWVQLERCPVCESENYKLGYHLAGGYFNCWQCGGIPARKVLETLGIPSRVVWRFLKERELDPETVVSRPAGKLKEPPGRGPMTRAHREYLRGRGFDPGELERTWELEGIGVAPRLSWRIYIPIARRGVRVSWTTRAIGDRVERRYIAAGEEEESMPRNELVYGLDFCRHSVVVVEGPADAWRIGPGAGALLGLSYSTAQVSLLARVPRRVICFDSSPAAQRRARELAVQLSAFPGWTSVLELDSEDPGSLPEKDVRRVRRLAHLS